MDEQQPPIQPETSVPPPPLPPKKFFKFNLSERDRKFLELVKKPWFIVASTGLVILLAGLLSVNNIMRALLHSRPEVVVPDVERKGILTALAAVSSDQLSLVQVGSEFDESLPAGTIVRQHPPAGMLVRAGRTVQVVISKGGQVVFVPTVVGLPLVEAQSRLAADGIQLGAVGEIYSTVYDNGVVAEQTPSSGTVVTRGALIDMVVSQGPPPEGVPIMPDFIGGSIHTARAWAEDHAVKIKITENPKAVGSAGTVVRQKPDFEQPLVSDWIDVTIVPLLASEQGVRFSYTVPDEHDKVSVRIKARGNRGEYNVYKGKHKGGDKIEVPLSVESTTRVRVYLDGQLDSEQVLEP